MVTDGFINCPRRAGFQIMIGRLTTWPASSKLAHGVIDGCLGAAGELEVETRALLIENGVDHGEFPDEVRLLHNSACSCHAVSELQSFYAFY